jgi:O-antigen/teichoic acid export membrane protein
VTIPDTADRRSRQDLEARLVAREAGGAWAAELLNGGFRYASAFFAARILGVSDFGAFSLALAVTGIGVVASGLGLSPGVLPFLSRARRSGGQTEIAALVRASLLLTAVASLVVFAVVFASAPWLSRSVFRMPELSGVLKALSPLIVLGTVFGTLATFLQGFLAVKERAWIEKVLAAGLTGVGLALGWIFGWGWPGVVVALLAGPAVGIACAAALLANLSQGALRSPPAHERLPTGELLAYSWPLLGTSVLIVLLSWSDVLLMGIFRDAREVGVYGLSARLAAGVLLFQESIGQVFLPRLSDLYAAEDHDGMRHLYHLTSRWAIWPALVAASALVLWGRDLLAVFGPGFAGGAAPLAVLAAAKAVGGSTGMSGRVFAVTGRSRLHLLNLMLMVACNIVLSLLWIPRHGAMGAAWAIFASLAAVSFLQVIQVRVLFGLLPWDRNCLVPIGGIIVLALGFLPLRHGFGGPFGWLLPLALFAVACLGLFLAWGVRGEERAVWQAMRSRMRDPFGS